MIDPGRRIDPNGRSPDLHARLNRAIERTLAMRDDAANVRLRLWRERFAQARVHCGRNQLLERALDAAVSVESADFANIQLLDANGRGLVMTAQRGFGQGFLDYFEFVADRTTACGLAMEQKRPVFVEDVVVSPIFEDSPALEVLLDSGVRAVRSVPLLGRDGRMFGMMSVHFRRERAHREPEVARFRELATSIARVIED